MPDHVPRIHGINPAGSTTFIAGRAAVPLFCYKLLTHRPLATSILGLLHLPTPSALQLSSYQLSPSAYPSLPPTALLVLSTSVLSFLRHSYWALFRTNNALPVLPASAIAIFNLLSDSANTLAFLARLGGVGDNAEVGPMQAVGALMFAAGMVIEVSAEEGRHAFKKDSKNKGKVDSTAAFSVVRHPNYAGYLLWRTGASLISGSAYVAVGTFAVNFLSFALQAIPGLDGYMSTRYGKQYSEYKNQVPYKLIPYIY